MKPARTKRVLILSHDTIGEKMAGPGIRYKNIADQISSVAKVTLALLSNSSVTEKTQFRHIKATGDSYKQLFDQHDIIFAQWLSREMLNYAKSRGKAIIIDLYAPVPIEYIASLGFAGKKILPQKDVEFSGILETYGQYLEKADLLVCSNERQRDFWIGFMVGLNILKPSNFDKDPKLNRIILCPMGIPTTPPHTNKLKMRKHLNIRNDEFVLLWTGGIWDWFDAKVIIRAVKRLDDPHIKLVFMGTKHPNTAVYIDEMNESKQARALAKKLGLVGKSVFFLDGWVPYKERASYLMDADIAIHADKESVETRFSHRTRVLDNIWAGLPTICNKGDYLSDLIEKSEMGLVVNTRSAEAFAGAIKKAYENPELLHQIKNNIQHARASFTWRKTTSDLLEFIERYGVEQVVQDDKLHHVPHQKFINYSSVIKKRIKNAVKVLIGRVNV